MFSKSRMNPVFGFDTERKIDMAVRSIVQVLAGAALVGVPTWVAAGQQDDTLSSGSGMAEMMTSSESHHRMMDSMSQMMGDPEMREQMSP